jgi:hypothetical protein
MKPSDLTPERIAEAMKISLAEVWRIALETENWYRPRRRVQIKGKWRAIDPPSPRLKKLFRRLHRFVQVSLKPDQAVHGGIRGRSCFTAAHVHKGRPIIITRDVQDCYPSVETDVLRRNLLNSGMRSDTAKLLSLLMTNRGTIAHGSPLSGDALNLFLQDGDERIRTQCARSSARYTRSADDMVISVRSGGAVSEHEQLLELEIRVHGLRVSEGKRERQGFQSCRERQRVHNLVVNSRRGIGIPAEQVAKAFDAGEWYVRSARSVSASSLESVAHNRLKARGWMNFCRQAQFGPAVHLGRLLESGDRLVRWRLRRVRVARTRKWWVVSRKRNRPRELAEYWRSIQPRPGCSGSP